MKLIIAFAVAILAADALSANEQSWVIFKQKHSKTYKNIVEEKLRFAVFQSNLKKIQEHNVRYEKGEVSYYLGVNHFADMTSEEFENMLLHQIPSKPNIEGNYADVSDVELPDSIDWREKGAVLGIKDQGNCGSCWAFSATGSLEGQNILINNLSIPLSEQELVDCSVLYDNYGCNGGLMTSAFAYVRDKGISSEESYPYKGSNGYGCLRGQNQTILRVTEYKIIAQEEEALKNAVATVGPIAVAIEATAELQLYKGGIFEGPSCQNDQKLLNHGVLAVGYNSEDGKDFWHVKNSWGADWGESGFFKLRRNPQICGFGLDASYPVVESN